MTKPDTPTPKLRYTLQEAAKKAGGAPMTLARQIKAGQVPHCYFEGHRYYIWIAHFDRHIGVAPPAPERNPLIKEIRFDRKQVS